MLDAFDQQYTVFQKIKCFSGIPGSENILGKGAWRQAAAVCKYVNNLSEELVSPEELIADNDADISVLGQILKKYQNLLEEQNLVDFSSLQVEAYTLLRNHPEILEELQSKIHYIMIDEYQDTNYIQEQIALLLAGERANICVVGDDDQGLYRFRGATIRNILEFPKKFDNCRVIPLVVNYRSDSSIVNFYNKWMDTTGGAKFKFGWGKFRYFKKIEPYKQTSIKSPSVVRLAGENEDEWHYKILDFINNLKSSGKLQDYNQIAFLFQSVKHPRVIRLANFLEEHHINVYSPRSDMFFQRKEIRLVLGCLMYMFPKYVGKLEKGEYEALRPEHTKYYIDCIKLAREYITKPEHKDLLIIGKFEYLHRVNVLDPATYQGRRRIDRNTEILFNLYLRLLLDGGITEYEDDSEYAPSGCVSFLTIHQSKGMEFPIVLVDSLGNGPRKNNDELIIEIEELYFKRKAFEPYEDIKYFDFWRLYYTAFSRAQDLLVLTCSEDKRTPSNYFKEVYRQLMPIESKHFDISEFDFKPIKDVNIKKIYSFTSNITVYETCARQYKFFKELEFMPVRANAMLFGILVHETIEDIHRAALRHEEQTITAENVSKWFNINYLTLSSTEHTYLAEPQREAALRQVLRYMERQQGNWSLIRQAEVDVSLVKPNYIIEGKVDLIRGEGDTVEIVDFKSQQKPDIEKSKELLEKYRRQLHIYAHLVEERTGYKVSKMHIYYTGEEDGVPTIPFLYSKTAIEGTMAVFDDTVQMIQKKDFHSCTNDLKVCKECDFRFYCKNK